MIKALQTKGLFQSLAEPNLVAESGKEASFLAGGEFPVPIAQGTGGGTSISVVFKEFGIRLTFTPIVIGNRVHLKVKPEVSTLDFTNGVSLNGFRIPALTTRRTETEVELNDGQTFAIAGLMNNTMNSTLQKIPGIGDIPILGLLFKSKPAQKNQTELVVMITPEILPNNSPGVTSDLPKLVEPYLPPVVQKKPIPVPPPAFKSAVAAQPAAPVATATPSPTNTTTLSPAAAAATLSANAPERRTVVQSPAPEPEPATLAVPQGAPTARATTGGATRTTPARERLAAEKATKEERKQQEISRGADGRGKKTPREAG